MVRSLILIPLATGDLSLRVALDMQQEVILFQIEVNMPVVGGYRNHPKDLKTNKGLSFPASVLEKGLT